MTSNMGKGLVGLGTLALVAVGFGVWAYGAYDHVSVGNVGVVKHYNGTLSQVGQGWQHVGWNASLVEYPAYLQGTKYSMVVGTADSQKMPVEVALNWQLNTKDVATVYQAVGGRSIDYVQTNIVDQKVQTIVNQVTHQYNWDSLLGKQMPDATKQIQEQLTTALASDGIILDSFGFTKVDPPSGMQAAQQATAQAELGKETAQAKQDQAKIENQTKIMNAQTDAQANEIEAQGIKAKAGAMSALTVQEEAIAKWDGKLPNTMTGGSVPFLSVGK